MNYGEIIKDSWHLTVENPRIKWLVLIPSFFAVLIFVIEVAWQVYLYLTKFELIGITSVEGYAALLGYITENGLWGISIMAGFLIVLFMFVAPAWVEGTLILCVRHKLLSPEVRFLLRPKMLKGCSYFFPIFKYHAATAIFSFISIGLFAASFYRYFDTIFAWLWPVILLYTIVAMIINLFLSFTPFYIVGQELPFRQAMKKSAALVFTHLGETINITLLMFLVNLRLLLNVIVVLGVPIAFFAAISIFNSSTAFVLTVIFALGMTALASYLTAIMAVFMTSVWAVSFEVLRTEHEEILAVDEVDVG